MCLILINLIQEGSTTNLQQKLGTWEPSQHFLENRNTKKILGQLNAIFYRGEVDKKNETENKWRMLVTDRQTLHF
jgi:hypothetical protein